MFELNQWERNLSKRILPAVGRKVMPADVIRAEGRAN